VRIEELEGKLLDYWVARSMGYRFWLEKRGAYELAVVQPPTYREPWMEHRDKDGNKPRYTEVFTAEELKCGFFGTGLRHFSTDWTYGGPIIEREAICVDKLMSPDWCAAKRNTTDDAGAWYAGPTPLIAAMRAYVASVYGETVTDGQKEDQNATL